jgi:hypothetical protein
MVVVLGSRGPWFVLVVALILAARKFVVGIVAALAASEIGLGTGSSEPRTDVHLPTTSQLTTHYSLLTLSLLLASLIIFDFFCPQSHVFLAADCSLHPLLLDTSYVQ